MSNNTKNIFKKEMRRTFRDKKSLAMMLITPIIIPLFIIGMGAFYNKMANKDVSQYNKIGFTYELSDTELEIAKDLNINVIRENEDKCKKLYKNKEIDLYITQNNDTYVINTNNSESSAFATKLIMSFFDALEKNKQSSMLMEANINPLEFYNVIKVDENVVEEESIMGNMLRIFGFTFCLMAITIAATYPATDTTAGEKERGTLETLLTFPIKAKDIIVGKFLSVSVSSIITGVISFALAAVSLNISQNMYEIFKDGGSITYNSVAILCGLAIIVAYGILVSGLAIAIASKSKTFKEAQSSLTGLTFIAMFPGMIASMVSIKTTLSMAVIPFLNSALVFKDACANKLNVMHLVVMFASTIVFIAIVLKVIIKQYKSEKVLFGK